MRKRDLIERSIDLFLKEVGTKEELMNRGGQVVIKNCLYEIRFDKVVCICLGPTYTGDSWPIILEESYE